MLVVPADVSKLDFLFPNQIDLSIFQSRHEPERRWYVINDSGSDGLGFID
jgi:hypothetical protein